MKNKNSELIIAQKTQENKLPSPSASLQVLAQEDSLFWGEFQELMADSSLLRSPQMPEEKLALQVFANEFGDAIAPQLNKGGQR
jgi:hypothetical protein